MSFKQLLEVIAAKPLLQRKDLARRYGKDVRTIDRYHQTGILPAPVYLRGSSIPLWRPCDILAAEKTRKELQRTITINS